MHREDDVAAAHRLAIFKERVFVADADMYKAMWPEDFRHDIDEADFEEIERVDYKDGEVNPDWAKFDDMLNRLEKDGQIRR